MNGVVAGKRQEGPAAPSGMLPRHGTHISAAPTIWIPGIIAKMPTSRPIATPRGTERRVKRHSSVPAREGPIQRLSSISSRVGTWR